MLLVADHVVDGGGGGRMHVFGLVDECESASASVDECECGRVRVRVRVLCVCVLSGRVRVWDMTSKIGSFSKSILRLDWVPRNWKNI